MNQTTKRFPRTMLEAWPNRHPYCVEHYKPLRSAGWEIAGVLVTVACVALFVYALLEQIP